MALGFGRKKTAGDAPATPVSAATEVAPVPAAPVPAHAPSSPPAPASPSADELDAFDLDSFAALPMAETPAPQMPAAATPGAAMPAQDNPASAFDFPAVPPTQVTMAGAAQTGASGVDTPDFDKLYEIEQANAARLAAPNSRPAAPAPFVPPSATIEEPAAPFYEPQVPVADLEAAAPKKKFPLVPVLGALAILGAGGVVASMMRPAPEVEDTAPIVMRPRVRPAPPATNTEAVQPSVPVKPVTLKPVPIKAGTARSAAVPKTVIATGAGAVRPGIAPATDQLTQLKALWNQGANAYHRKDMAAARRYWTQGLKMQPGNVGFQESLAKLK